MGKKKSNQESNLFVYGTLRAGQSRNYIINGLEYEKAILFNYRKVKPPSLDFPLIIQDSTSSVQGEIYYSLNHSLINQIDVIEGEGELYHRIIVNVVLDSGDKVEAFTYYPSEKLIQKYI